MSRHQKYQSGCHKCRHNHRPNDDHTHRHHDCDCDRSPDSHEGRNETVIYQNPICAYLVGTMKGNYLYQPPIQDSCHDRQETINLKTIIYIRRCHVQGHYGELENRGLLFQSKDKTEIQVNYYNEKQAECEYNILVALLGNTL